MVLQVSLNYWAIIGATVVSMLLGSAWYSKHLFGRTWMKLSGITMKDLKEKKKQGLVARAMFGQVLITLVTAFVLAHFVDYMEAVTFRGGAQAGFWIWLGFVATSGMMAVLWGGKSFRLYLLDTAHELVNLIIIGGILAIWA